MAEVLDELAGLKEVRLAEYHAAVDRMLAGEEIAADELEMICLRAGKEPAAFAREIRTRQHRAKERERLQTLPDVRAKLAAVNAEIVENNASLEAAVQAHRIAAFNFEASRIALINELSELSGIEQELMKTCGVGAYSNRLFEIERYQDSLRHRRSDALRQLQAQQAALRQVSAGQVDRWWVDRDARSPELPMAVDDNDPLATHKRRVLRAQAAIDDLDRQSDEYLAEAADLRRKQFEW